MPHLDAAYNLARWLARSPDDADDVVQEACMKALRYIDSLRGEEARAWFLAIVRNTFYDWARRNRPQEIVHAEDEVLEQVADEQAVGPEQAALAAARTRTLAEEVERLPAHYREVIVLRELEDLSYRDIAAITETPIGTVMSRLSRARAILQQAPRLQEFSPSQGGA